MAKSPPTEVIPSGSVPTAPGGKIEASVTEPLSLLGDTAQAEVLRATPPGGATEPQGAVNAALADIRSPEHAMAVLKAKASLLHTLLSNAGHFSSVAFADVEQLMADIRWLAAYVRSKI